MKLMHFSNAEAIVTGSRVHVQDSNFKPRGLWVSDESEGSHGWRAWCESEEYGIGRNAFTVELASTANLLTLATPEAIKEFDAEFCRDGYYIDWAAVADRWQGILITPYQWSLRLSDVRWYYPWDCASGCIWDASAIAAVSRVSAEAVAS